MVGSPSRTTITQPLYCRAIVECWEPLVKAGTGGVVARPGSSALRIDCPPLAIGDRPIAMVLVGQRRAIKAIPWEDRPHGWRQQGEPL